jgi:hypothetical protein
MKKIAFLFILALMVNCKNENEIVSYKELIIGTWKNDYNLDKDSLKYFVPQSTELSASRFRPSMTFENDNKFSILVLSPNDAHYLNYGTWSWKDDKTIIATVTNTNKIVFNHTFKIILLEKDKLIVNLKQE